MAHRNAPGAVGDPKEPALRPRIIGRHSANGAPEAGPAAADPATAGGPRYEAPGWQRTLQLALAALWPLGAVLRYQNFMFSQGFPRMLAATAAGNPRPRGGPAHRRTRHGGPAPAPGRFLP